MGKFGRRTDPLTYDPTRLPSYSPTGSGAYDFGPEQAYLDVMALVRILVDGQGLLESWGDVAPGRPRQTAHARQELITRLTQYYDAGGVPLTVVFDGATSEEDETITTPEVDVSYTKRGQTEEQALARLADRYRSCGTVLLVTDRELGKAVTALGQVQTTQDFVKTVTEALDDLAENITRFNQESQSNFKRQAPR